MQTGSDTASPQDSLHSVESVTKVAKAGYNIAGEYVSGQINFTAAQDLLLLVKTLEKLLASESRRVVE
jgi:hypothetical protein